MTAQHWQSDDRIGTLPSYIIHLCRQSNYVPIERVARFFFRESPGLRSRQRTCQERRRALVQDSNGSNQDTGSRPKDDCLRRSVGRAVVAVVAVVAWTNQPTGFRALVRFHRGLRNMSTERSSCYNLLLFTQPGSWWLPSLAFRRNGTAKETEVVWPLLKVRIFEHVFFPTGRPTF